MLLATASVSASGPVTLQPGREEIPHKFCGVAKNAEVIDTDRECFLAPWPCLGLPEGSVCESVFDSFLLSASLSLSMPRLHGGHQLTSSHGQGENPEAQDLKKKKTYLLSFWKDGRRVDAGGMVSCPVSDAT